MYIGFNNSYWHTDCFPVDKVLCAFIAVARKCVDLLYLTLEI